MIRTILHSRTLMHATRWLLLLAFLALLGLAIGSIERLTS